MKVNSFYQKLLKGNQIQVLCSILLVILSYCWLFHQWIYTLVTKRWIAADYSYCFLIPIISIYIAWEIKKKTKHYSFVYSSPLLGYVFLLIATIFFLIGRLGSLETFIYISMWLAIVGCVGVLFGKQTLLRYCFPLFILAFIVPAPPFITRLMSFKLRLISTKIAAHVLQAIGIPCYREGNIIDLGITKLQVVHACSGLRYVIPIIIISFIIGYLHNNRKWWSSVILFILAIPVAIIGNAIRLVLLAVCSVYISLAVVKNQLLHDFIGWIVFILSVGIIFGINRILIKIFGEKTVILQHQNSFCASKKNHILLHGIILTILFVSLYFGQHVVYVEQIIPSRQSFDSFPMRIGNWIGKREFLSKRILDSLWADDYISAIYYNIKTGDKLHLLISYYKKQTALHTAHAPLSCLLGSGFELVSRKVLNPDKDTGRWFPVVQLVLKKGNLIVLSNFWFDQRGRIITNEYLNKAYLFLDAIKMRRTDGALVRIEMPLVNNQDINNAQKELDKFLVLLKTIINNNYIPQ